MIDSSKEFREVINNSSRVMSIHDEYIFVDGASFDINRKVFKRYSINEATSDSSGFNIGATVIKEYKASLDNTDGIFDTFDFEGLDIAAKVGLLLKDGSVEVIPKGKFRCVSAKNNENTIDIKAYDSMLFFDRPYTESNLRYPATIQQIIADACLCCEMTYDASTIQNVDYVVNERPEDSNLTFRDIIGFCAQIMCSYAVINKLDQLSFGWYDFDTLGILQNNYDGGSFAYTDGDSFDGGSFTDYSSGDSVDGGSLEEQRMYHHLYSLGSRSINTDDICITGIAVKPSSDYVDGDSIYLCGEEGYVLLIEENPLIQSIAQTETVAKYIAEKMNGKRFRPLNISCKSNPCIEAGDCVCVTDRKNRTYFTVITNTTFSFGALQQIECTAETPTEKNFTKYSVATKLLSKAKNDTKKQLTAYDVAVQQLTSLITCSFGAFKTEEKKKDGSVIYYLHNKPELSDSSTIWKMTAEAFAVSTDGGKTWNAGLDSEGNAVVNILSAIGINADWILTGLISDALGKNFWNLDTGEFSMSATAKVGKSTVASKQNVADAKDSAYLYAENAVQGLNDSLTTQEVFNRLTNNGAVQGLFMKDGQLYINVEYLAGTKISGKAIDATSIYFSNNTDNIESTAVVNAAVIDLSIVDNNYDNPALYTSSVVLGANGLLYLIGRNIEIYEHNMTTWNGSIKFLDTVYNNGGGTAFTSDRNDKHSVEDLDIGKTEQFIYSLTPCKFKYNSGTSDRFHHGLIAQDVKECMGAEDWGLYVKQVDEDGTAHLALRYDELIADLIAAVQSQNKRILQLEKRLGVANV